MHPQENSSSAPQPLRMSLNASSDQLQKLAESIHYDKNKRRTFERDPNSILQEFGLELHNPGEWIKAPAFSDQGNILCATELDTVPDPTEIAIACIVVASTISVGVAVCVAIAAVPEEPVIEGDVTPDPNPVNQ